MKVILLQNVKGVGMAGDAKEISDGYARNFLIPKKMAEIATPEGIQKAELAKSQQEEKNKSVMEKNQKLAEDLKKKKIEIRGKEKKGKLFGSITAKEIAKEIKNQGLDLDEKSIILKSPIKEIGEFTIEIDLGHQIKSSLKLSVKGE